EQTLMNLVTNAKDAMPQGGTLTISLTAVEMQERFEHAHGIGKPGKYACISITDTGHGMDAETREKIFEPFFTTKEIGKGTGLGMAIIYGIISQHNGYVSVESEPGSGTTFHLYLPLMAKDERSIKESQQEELPAGGTETILMAEDDPAVRNLHSMMLEEAGYTVIAAVDGSDALNKFFSHEMNVDILVTDVIMPKLDGKRLIEKIREVRPGMKVLFMSGYTKDLFVQRGILDKEFNFLSKPVSATELLKAVRDILDQN
ncbi:MAG TPA: ATP-binding protein, partial [Geobacteraceae bacterium]|nr:ATP-binding protein [Geobacteraceae bacterium]